MTTIYTFLIAVPIAAFIGGILNLIRLTRNVAREK